MCPLKKIHCCYVWMDDRNKLVILVIIDVGLSESARRRDGL